MVSYEWRGPFRNAELSALHAAGFGQPAQEHDWQAQVRKHSLGWVCARDGTGLAGFVNVAWDGGSHAFILDTVVAARLQRHGAGTKLVAVAAEQARAAGCAWLHVDFEPDLGSFDWDSFGFRLTSAGLIAPVGTPSIARRCLRVFVRLGGLATPQPGSISNAYSI